MNTLNENAKYIKEKHGFYRPITFVGGGKLLCYKRNKLFLYDGSKMNFFREFEIKGYRGILSKTRFLTRIFHRYVFCGVYLPKEDIAFIAANDGIYKVPFDGREIVRCFDFKYKDMHRPLSFFEIKGVKGFDDCIAFGEYCYNQDRNPISFYVYRQSISNWEKVYSFNDIRHIHSIIPDTYNDRVLVLTGDKDSECGVFEFKNNFSEVRTISRGNQQLRFCCGKAYPDGVVLVTDSPFEQNYIYKLSSNDTFEKKHEIPGPTVFFTANNDNLYFATDVENDEKNLTPFKEFFINKKGDGVLDDYSHLFCYNPVKGAEEIAKFKKDFWPMRIFGFGTIHFPYGFSENDELYCYPMSVSNYDQTLIKIRKNED